MLILVGRRHVFVRGLASYAGGRIRLPGMAESSGEDHGCGQVKRPSGLPEEENRAEKEAGAQWSAEQLQRRHEAERQQLRCEQVEQLKSFRTQLLQELWGQLSPAVSPSPLHPPSPLALSLTARERGPLTSRPGDSELSPARPQQLLSSVKEGEGREFLLDTTAGGASPDVARLPCTTAIGVGPHTEPITLLHQQCLSHPPSTFPPPPCSSLLPQTSTRPTENLSFSSTTTNTAITVLNSSLPPYVSYTSLGLSCSQLPPIAHLTSTSEAPPSPAQQQGRVPWLSTSTLSLAETRDYGNLDHASPSLLPASKCLHLPLRPRSCPLTIQTGFPSTSLPPPTCSNGSTSLLPPPEPPNPPLIYHHTHTKRSPAYFPPTTPPLLLSSLHLSSCHSTPLSSAPAIRTYRQTVGGDVATAKSSLIEKHGKHMRDLKRYYEGELAELRSSLELLAGGTERASLTSLASGSVSLQQGSVRRGTSLSPLRSPTKPGSSQSPVRNREDEYQKVQVDHQKLKRECLDLQSKLEQCTIKKNALEERLEKHQEIWGEWQTEAESTFQVIAVLQDRLESVRAQLLQEQSTVEQLQVDLQSSVGEIQHWKEQRRQEADKLQQVLGEFEVVQKENKVLLEVNASLKDEGSVTHRDVTEMRASVQKYQSQEKQLKCTIVKLEEEVSHLRHVNNRLHGQATHFSLGPSNSPDEDKLKHSPPSLPHTAHPHTTPAPLTPHPPTSHTSHTSHPSHPTTLSSGGSKSTPLNRRKWLEPSDPGLIFGSPSYSTASSNSPRAQLPASHLSSTSSRSGQSHPHPSPSTSLPLHRSPRLQSTGQSLVPEMSSTNEEEDRAISSSLSNRDDLSLVESTLTAIQRGRIRTQERSSNKSPRNKSTGSPVEQREMEERVQRNLRVVAEAEKRFAELQNERKMLESALQRVPREGSRVTRQVKQNQLEMERRLEVVLKDIGSVRMTLRSHHALGVSK